MNAKPSLNGWQSSAHITSRMYRYKLQDVSKLIQPPQPDWEQE